MSIFVIIDDSIIGTYCNNIFNVTNVQTKLTHEYSELIIYIFFIYTYFY